MDYLSFLNIYLLPYSRTKISQKCSSATNPIHALVLIADVAMCSSRQVAVYLIYVLVPDKLWLLVFRNHYGVQAAA